MSRCLVDEHLSSELVDALTVAGMDVVTPYSLGLIGSEDSELADLALREGRWIITNDWDFVALASDALHDGRIFPSVIIWPQQSGRGIGYLSAEIVTLLRASAEGDFAGVVIYL